MKNILVIDDDKDILQALEILLLSEGYSVHAVSKADNVYSLVNDTNPDLIVLDVLLSGKDGRTICKELKSNTNTKNIPVLMISAHPHANKTTQEVNADKFIAKPFDSEYFVTEIKKLIN